MGASASKSLNFNPSTDIPSLSGKTILVTGGTAGLGRETVLAFAAHDAAHIYFTGRNESSAKSLLDEVHSKHPSADVSFLKCDLASFASIQKASRDLLSKIDRLDILMANAGVMALPPSTTQDGYEIQFGTNHMGHALLVKLLLPLMETTAQKEGDARIVWNSSIGYMAHPKGGVIFDKVKTAQADIGPVFAKWTRYGQSKVANMWYSRELAKHHPSITSVAIHPGTAATGLVTGLSFSDRLVVYLPNMGSMITAEECAFNQEWAATAPRGTGDRQVESGQYYEPVGKKVVPGYQGNNQEGAAKLWSWTQDELKGWEL